MITYTVRIGSDEPLTFDRQPHAWGAAAEAIADEAARGGHDERWVLSRLAGLSIQGQASIGAGRTITISVRSTN